MHKAQCCNCHRPKLNLQLLQIHKQTKKRPYNNKTHKSQSTRVYKNSISPSSLQWLQCSLARWASGRLPCKHARSNPHPSISLEALARSGPDDSCTLACFQTGSVWAKPDTARTQLDPGWFCTVWSRPATECERGNLEAGQLHSARNGAQWFFHFSLLLDKVHLAKTWPGHPDRTPD